MAIPIEFKTISYLEELDLHSNNFTGGLDYIFAKTSDGGHGFRLLDLSDNMFAGPVDEDIGNLNAIQAVESLILSNNPLGGSIPKSLGKMYSLRTLKLENNGLTGTIPAELSNATLLTSIMLSNNNLTGGIPSGVINLTSLKELDVSHNMLTGEIPPHNATIPAASFEGNAGLCGSPLPPCKDA
ncbi:putative receptor like protein 25 [Papaver somniferum]|uniref:putative receptor like protein 25 n=1 Tax=Papaver somniferum TaxID=3469 RepID=UPI000E6FD435|nr:putative receptor like protein 25 [Papaver somniferum]